MSVLQWEKLSMGKLAHTLWGDGGSDGGAKGAAGALEKLMEPGRAFEIDISALEGRFARPDPSARFRRAESDNSDRSTVGSADGGTPRARISLLEPKRSTSVGIAENTRRTVRAADVDFSPP